MTEPTQKPQASSRIRFALLVFCGVYPAVTVLQLILAPLTVGWPLPLRNLVFVVLMVIIMVWGIIPFIQTRLRRWL